jgi:tRNA pseudouridine65 synthase
VGACFCYRRVVGVTKIIDPLQLEIIYQDDHLVAINKPHGLLVHRSRIAKDASEFALQLLRDQLGQRVYPCHRLDRKTSGVLLFAKDEDTNRLIQMKFADGQITKRYLAIVRGYTNDKGIIDYPLKKEDGNLQEAVTAYETIERTEINVPFLKQPTSRYSLVQVKPLTGRMHQIRKHFAHIFHPIIADRPHGCNKQNRLFKKKWDMDTMLLHAYSLSFIFSDKEILIEATPSKEFLRTSQILNFNTGILSKIDSL